MYSRKKITTLLQKIATLEQQILDAESKCHPLIEGVHPDNAPSARNLIHYLSLRTNDLTNLQKELSHIAISSHGHSEAYTLNNLQKIKHLLNALIQKNNEDTFNALDDEASTRILNRNTTNLFGKIDYNGQTKIMVTLATETADDPTMVQSLIKAGMDIARINTSHDNPSVWEKMIVNIRAASKALQRDIKLFIDLEGPKIRTGPIKTLIAPGAEKAGKKPGILLFKGDKLNIIKSTLQDHETVKPEISLVAPPVLDYLKPGERVYFDDGKMCAVICEIQEDKIIVEIIQAPADGFKLKAERGVNFPESNLVLPALTKADLENLDFIAAHADMVGLSFVQAPNDIFLLQRQFKKRNREDIGIILKIETKLGFNNLPLLQLAAMHSPHSGIMIARGDLAVEIGFLRMAEVQEEILWLAEAAHMPVIWATQVLESQIKKGYTTRAEVSDVVKSVRSECVMLNKGKHLAEAIKMIRDIDKRMAAHEDKKRKKLRAMEVARSFFSNKHVAG